LILGWKGEFYSLVIESQLKDGVDFMIIHAGITLQLAGIMVKSNRIVPTVS